MLGERAYNIALRQDAREAPSRAVNHERADAVRGQKACRRREIGCRFDAYSVAAQLLGGQDRLDVHGGLQSIVVHERSCRTIGSVKRQLQDADIPPQLRLMRRCTNIVDWR